jgi:hypothetical protein
MSCRTANARYCENEGYSQEVTENKRRAKLLSRHRPKPRKIADCATTARSLSTPSAPEAPNASSATMANNRKMKGIPKKLLKTKEEQNCSRAIVPNHEKLGIAPRQRGRFLRCPRSKRPMPRSAAMAKNRKMKGTPKKLLKTKEEQNCSRAIVPNHEKFGIGYDSAVAFMLSALEAPNASSAAMAKNRKMKGTPKKLLKTQEEQNHSLGIAPNRENLGVAPGRCAGFDDVRVRRARCPAARRMRNIAKMKGTPKKLLKTIEEQNCSRAIVPSQEKFGAAPQQRGCFYAVRTRSAQCPFLPRWRRIGK